MLLCSGQRGGGLWQRWRPWLEFRGFTAPSSSPHPQKRQVDLLNSQGLLQPLGDILDHEANLVGLIQPAMNVIFTRRADVPAIDKMKVFC